VSRYSDLLLEGHSLIVPPTCSFNAPPILMRFDAVEVDSIRERYRAQKATRGLSTGSNDLNAMTDEARLPIHRNQAELEEFPALVAASGSMHQRAPRRRSPASRKRAGYRALFLCLTQSPLAENQWTVCGFHLLFLQLVKFLC
jgi:hypothetical protein